VLDEETMPKFKELCGSSCIVLIAITNSKKNQDPTKPGYFKIQVSQGLQELLENVKVEGLVTENSPYKYYKFYKACDMECDLILDVYPLSSYGSTLNVMVNY
jgi:hypothetical protein